MNDANTTGTEMNIGDTIKIARRAVYASSTCSEREYEKVITAYRKIEGQDAAIISVQSPKGGTVITGRLVGNYIDVYYPKNAKYEII
jgi:glutamine amidotransferase-like uncharacterized protein